MNTISLRGRDFILPVGETVLWQGRSNAWALAFRAFHMRAVALYFVALAAWRIWSGITAGHSTADAVTASTILLGPAAAALGLLGLVAWLNSCATRYTITNKRVVMEFGVALPISLNIPLSEVKAAALKVYRGGVGDIPLSVSDPKRLSFIFSWPHARPWRPTHVEPMLRGVPDAKAVAAVLSGALKATFPAGVVTASAAAPVSAERHTIKRPLATAAA